MNDNQNRKIAQITSETLIIGVDIAKFKHVARAHDFRWIEFGAPLFFENTKSGLDSFIDWMGQVSRKQGITKVIVGMEPTGHYWLNLAYFLKEQDIKFVVVNPMHVKKSKELDDNSPTKNDVKDARVIAQLVKDGDTLNLTFRKECMPNFVWQEKYAIFYRLTFKLCRDKSITG